jgi:hypothetical protein
MPTQTARMFKVECLPSKCEALSTTKKKIELDTTHRKTSITENPIREIEGLGGRQYL